MTDQWYSGLTVCFCKLRYICKESEAVLHSSTIIYPMHPPIIIEMYVYCTHLA